MPRDPFRAQSILQTMRIGPASTTRVVGPTRNLTAVGPRIMIPASGFGYRHQCQGPQLLSAYPGIHGWHQAKRNRFLKSGLGMSPLNGLRPLSLIPMKLERPRSTAPTWAPIRQRSLSVFAFVTLVVQATMAVPTAGYSASNADQSRYSHNRTRVPIKQVP